jgi:hypothetical protein
MKSCFRFIGRLFIRLLLLTIVLIGVCLGVKAPRTLCVVHSRAILVVLPIPMPPS